MFQKIPTKTRCIDIIIKPTEWCRCCATLREGEGGKGKGEGLNTKASEIYAFILTAFSFEANREGGRGEGGRV